MDTEVQSDLSDLGMGDTATFYVRNARGGAMMTMGQISYVMGWPESHGNSRIRDEITINWLSGSL